MFQRQSTTTEWKTATVYHKLLTLSYPTARNMLRYFGGLLWLSALLLPASGFWKLGCNLPAHLLGDSETMSKALLSS
jgi:hypothetical protein